MAAFDLPVWLHPFRGADITDYATETKSLYEIWWTFGWPYETSVAMSRLVFSGIFDRHPGLKIITHHLGAMAPYFEGRVGPGWDQLGTRTSDEDYGAVLKRLKKRPIDYFKMFYADTAVFGAYDATVCGLNFFGAGHVLFASDAPFDPETRPDVHPRNDRDPRSPADVATPIASGSTGATRWICSGFLPGKPSEAESQPHRGDLRFQEVLVQGVEPLAVDFVLDGEVVEDVGEREQQLGALVHDRPFGGEVD